MPCSGAVYFLGIGAVYPGCTGGLPRRPAGSERDAESRGGSGGGRRRRSCCERPGESAEADVDVGAEVEVHQFRDARGGSGGEGGCLRLGEGVDDGAVASVRVNPPKRTWM